MADARCIVMRVIKHFKFVSVVAVQPVLGSYPQETVPALDYFGDQALGEPFVDRKEGRGALWLREPGGTKQENKEGNGYRHKSSGAIGDAA